MSDLDKIPDFDPLKITERPGAITFIGGSHSGKSSTSARIINEIQHSERGGFFQMVFVYSDQAVTTEEWMSWLSTKGGFQKQRVLESQDLDRTLVKIDKMAKQRPSYKWLLIIDDWIGGSEREKELQYKKSTLKNIFFKSRHSNVWSFWMLQDITSLSARFLGNALANFIHIDLSEVTMENHLYCKILCPTRKACRNKGIGPKSVSRRKWCEWFIDMLDDLPYLGALVVFKDPQNKIHLFKYTKHEFLAKKKY